MQMQIITNKTTPIPVDSNGRYQFDQTIFPPFKINTTDLKKVDSVFKRLAKRIKKYNNIASLDFHGVTDLFELGQDLPNHALPKFVLSYVGGNPKTLGSTINTICSRIKSKEVIFGIIVFIKDDKPICGTKGWVLSNILNWTKINIHFVDDGQPNIKCVDKLNNKLITTHYLNSKTPSAKQDLTKLLDSF